ncbi:hypothetical protein BaRGS_00019077 [Batillaria attramentaria]|uniref:Uncharacterized protein n=1 Tax=Batillaria attramentaria TaxID=370345 RepID=A0ABD0KRF1_9CAEN
MTLLQPVSLSTFTGLSPDESRYDRHVCHFCLRYCDVGNRQERLPVTEWDMSALFEKLDLVLFSSRVQSTGDVISQARTAAARCGPEAPPLSVEALFGPLLLLTLDD